MSNMQMNWAEVAFATNMIWTTMISGYFGSTDFESVYHYWYKLGDSMAILIDDLINFKPKDAFE